MDKLSSLIVGMHKTKVASATLKVQPPELDVFEKLAYAKALAGACLDQNFLEQFEGTELLPQAIALCEQELAMEQRQLQQRMQQMAQNQNTNWEQNCIDEDGIRLQKQQLVLALYKNKAMTPPKQPGDAEIGTPDPAAQAMAPAAEAGTAGAPVEEPAVPKLSALIMKSASEFALPDKKKYPIPDEAHGRNALARASQFASKSEQGTIREAVHRKFPGIHETDASKPAEPTVKKSSLLEAMEASFGRPFGKEAMSTDEALHSVVTYAHDPKTRNVLRHHEGSSTPLGSTADIKSKRNYTVGGGLLGGLFGAVQGAAAAPETPAGFLIGGAGGALLGGLAGRHVGEGVENDRIVHRLMSLAANDKYDMTPEQQTRRDAGLQHLATNATKKANALSALVPGAKTTAQELGAALRLRTQQRGAQQLASTLGHVPAPGANPFHARPQVAPPPAWVGKTAGTGRTMSPSSSSSKPKKQSRRNVQPSVSFGALIDQLAGGAN